MELARRPLPEGGPPSYFPVSLSRSSRTPEKHSRNRHRRSNGFLCYDNIVSNRIREFQRWTGSESSFWSNINATRVEVIVLPSSICRTEIVLLLPAGASLPGRKSHFWSGSEVSTEILAPGGKSKDHLIPDQGCHGSISNEILSYELLDRCSGGAISLLCEGEVTRGMIVTMLFSYLNFCGFYIFYIAYTFNFLTTTCDESNIRLHQKPALVINFGDLVHPCSRQSCRNSRFLDSPLIFHSIRHTHRVIQQEAPTIVWISG